ncbi:MAG: hypothetical protein OXQ90_09850, partial [Gammaproteobacteria bacterium]|nr:hypothetical protein [Gammaproteobacteria bacterium]
MKDPNLRLVTEIAVDGSDYTCVIPDKCGNVVCAEIPDRIPPVISEVVEDEIKPVGEQRPEWIVRICRESVGVAEHQPRTIRVAMPPER